MPLLHRIARATNEYVLSESTRAYIEKMVAEWIAEDHKDPEYRRMVKEITRGHYDRSKRRLKGNRRRPKRRK